jgi:hypothetical protein
MYFQNMDLPNKKDDPDTIKLFAQTFEISVRKLLLAQKAEGSTVTILLPRFLCLVNIFRLGCR